MVEPFAYLYLRSRAFISADSKTPGLRWQKIFLSVNEILVFVYVLRSSIFHSYSPRIVFHSNHTSLFRSRRVFSRVFFASSEVNCLTNSIMKRLRLRRAFNILRQGVLYNLCIVPAFIVFRCLGVCSAQFSCLF